MSNVNRIYPKMEYILKTLVIITMFYHGSSIVHTARNYIIYAITWTRVIMAYAPYTKSIMACLIVFLLEYESIHIM